MRAASSVVLVALLASTGCRPSLAPDGPDDHRPVGAASQPTVDAVEFVAEAHGFRLAYPSDWQPSPSDDFVLKLMNAVGTAAMSVDVPTLPPHIPGLIPLGLVVSGYLDDLKAQHAGLRVEENVVTKVAGSTARRVRSAWTSGGGLQVEEAVLTVHGDRVYIIRLNAEQPGYASALDAYERLLSTVKLR